LRKDSGCEWEKASGNKDKGRHGFSAWEKEVGKNDGKEGPVEESRN